MKLLTVIPLALQVSLVLAAEPWIGDFQAPGRADRLFHKRAPRDLGTFEVDCKGAEGACNNACFYIRCLVCQQNISIILHFTDLVQHPNDPNANRITYIGPNGGLNDEAQRNRYESGCDFKAQHSGSVCRNFPFSQKFSNKLVDDWQCRSSNSSIRTLRFDLQIVCAACLAPRTDRSAANWATLSFAAKQPGMTTSTSTF
jgi:hypothetical protein